MKRRRGPNKPADERKDHLIQARVPRDLDAVLKQDAKRRRLSVSHLIRNVLQDTYELVDGVIGEVDQIVQDSVQLTGRVTRDAKEIARSAAGLRERATSDRKSPEPAAEREESSNESPRSRAAASPAKEGRRGRHDAEASRDFEAQTADVYAWQAVVLNREAQCVRCARALLRGETANLGLSQTPSTAPRWLCPSCLALLADR